MKEDDLHEHLDRLRDHLPETLRDDWVVVPKRELRKAVWTGLLLGATGTLLIIGLATGTTWMVWPFGVLVFGGMLAAKYLPWWRGDRFIEQLRRTPAGQGD